MNGNGKTLHEVKKDTKWLVTTIVAIAAASFSTFVSASWSLAEHGTRIELASKTLDTHVDDGRVHVDHEAELTKEGRLARIEALLEMAIDRLDNLSNDARVR